MTAPNTVTPLVPTHWSPEQALAVFECLHALREALWAAYGPQVQHAWRDQLGPEQDLPPFDPDAPF
jgi:hypothetical protein